MKSEKSKNKVKKVISIILTLVFIICIIYLIIVKYNAKKNENMYLELYESMVIEPDETTTELANINDKFIEKIKELQQINEDVKGWIRIEGTTVNYPLLQTSDNDYYLTHNYKKEKSSYGSIFMKQEANLLENNSNVIIYGHNMRDEQMFNNLLKYKDKKYYQEHPTIKIFTDEQETEYKIVSVFNSKVFYEYEQNVFRYYQYNNFEDENKYNEYISNCKKIQLYDTGENVQYGEQLLTLITCEYSQENGRLIVIAKRS